MAIVQFRVECRNSGVLTTLTPPALPVWDTVCQADGTSIKGGPLMPVIAPQGVITGIYVFSADLTALGGSFYGVIDMTSAISAAGERYVYFDSGTDVTAQLAEALSEAKLARQALCNKRVEPDGSGTASLYNDAGDTVIASWTKTDNGVTTTRTPR